MFIVSRDQSTYARLFFSAGPGGEALLSVEVDWAAWPQATEAGGWEQRLPGWRDEYEQNVQVAAIFKAFKIDEDAWWGSDEVESIEELDVPDSPLRLLSLDGEGMS